MFEPVLINESDLSPEEVKQLMAMGFDVADQGSEKWLQERLGLATASHCFDIVNWTKGTPAGQPTKTYPNGKPEIPPKPQRSYYAYMYQLVGERLSGKPKRFGTKQMAWGNDHEEEAATVYGEVTGLDVRTLGFIKHEKLDAGASLDRTVGDNGLLEIKCPNTGTLVEYFDHGIPDVYYAQMQFQMWIAHKTWGHFMVYDPEIEFGSKYYLEFVPRSESYIEQIDLKVTKLLSQVDELEKRYKDYDFGDQIAKALEAVDEIQLD